MLVAPAPIFRQRYLPVTNVGQPPRVRLKLLRWMERVLPGALFRGMMSPLILGRSVYELWRNRKQVGGLRRVCAASSGSRSLFRVFREYYRFESTRYLFRWPDRLCEPAWQRRCRIVGRQFVADALASDRPIVLVTLHYGFLPAMFHWLRAQGWQAAAMSHPLPHDPVRDYILNLADQANGLAGVHRIFEASTSDLWNARDFLAQPGRMLLVAMDGGHGTKPVIAEIGRLRFTVRTGAFRLAAATDAIVIPCLFRSMNRMGCEIHFTEPVPAELVSNRRRQDQAARFVLERLYPLLKQCPQQFDLFHLPRPRSA